MSQVIVFVILKAPRWRLQVRHDENEESESQAANQQVGLALLRLQMVIAVVLILVKGHFLHFLVEGDLELHLSDGARYVRLLDLIKRLGPVCDLPRKRLVFSGTQGPWRALSR